MVDLQKQPFTTGSQIVANYDYSDIQTGIGINDYYLISAEDTSGTTYHLGDRNDFSADTNISQGIGNSTQTYNLSPFVIPQLFTGTAKASYACYAPAAETYHITAQLFHVDSGATATAITAEIQSPTETAGAKMVYMNLPITNEKQFEEGSYLRLVTKFTHVAFSGAPVLYGIDPAGRTHPNLSVTTTSKISVPSKLSF